MEQNLVVGEQLVTPEMAKDWLLNHNNHNRPLSTRQIEFYAQQMKDGKWMRNGESICFDWNGILLDGQHRLAAIIKANRSITLTIVRGVDPECFKTYDSGRNRTAGDCLAIKGIPHSNGTAAIIRGYYGLHKGYSTLGRANTPKASRYVGNGSVRLTNNDVCAFYDNHKQLSLDTRTYAERCTYKMKILGTTEMGAYILYLHLDKGHSIDKIRRFFDMLFQMDGLFDTTSAINTLRSKLINDMGSAVKMTSKARKQLIAKAWNAYISNKDRKVLLVTEEEVEFI